MELLPEQPTSINCTLPRLLAGLGGDQWTRCQAFAEIRRVYPARQSARVLRGEQENPRIATRHTASNGHAVNANIAPGGCKACSVARNVVVVDKAG
jgi:hypothetical protein